MNKRNKNRNKKRKVMAMILGLFSIGKAGFKKEARITSAISNTVKTNSDISLLNNNCELSKMRLQDDFYTSVNESWMKNAKIPEGEVMYGTINQVSEINEKNILNILKELSSVQETQNKKGTAEQKLADFYKSVIDLESRNKQGVNPIKKYLDLYDNAKNLVELWEADFSVFNETGRSCLVSAGIDIDAKDSNKNILKIIGLTSHLRKHTIDSEDAQKAYEKFITRLLELSGESKEKAQLDAKEITKLEKILSDSTLEAQELYDIDKTYNMFNIEELSELYPNLNISRVLENMGFKNVKSVKISDVNKFKKSYEYFNEKNFDILKLYAKTRVLIRYGRYLSQDFTDALDEVNKALFGIKGKMSIEKKAVRAVSGWLEDDLGKIFVQKFFSEDAKKDIENLILKIKSSYKEKIKNATWLSEKTREKAIKKLDTMKLKIGYPEKWSDELDKADIKNYEDGGSYFANICEMQKKLMQRRNKELDEPVDKTKWQMSAYEVNAYYEPQNNEIVFPAGILQSPFYDINAPEEQNMGAIGAIIAHEISHAFDSVGSKFDENGNAVNWWTDQDRENFKKRCEKFVNAYDNLEISEGVKNNGKLTLFENIADVGAVSCMLDILSKKENPDYKKFFESYATTWRMIASPEIIKQLSKTDVHSANKIRTNRTLANFEEFYEAFDIKSDDKMYVAPEDRVSLW
ncbi:MAG: M13 family metallopeptidase [Clostridia bacterium]|nr:M13 family metallopeptidase [Clostridia bacterium]